MKGEVVQFKRKRSSKAPDPRCVCGGKGYQYTEEGQRGAIPSVVICNCMKAQDVGGSK